MRKIKAKLVSIIKNLKEVLKINESKNKVKLVSINLFQNYAIFRFENKDGSKTLMLSFNEWRDFIEHKSKEKVHKKEAMDVLKVLYFYAPEEFRDLYFKNIVKDLLEIEYFRIILE